MNRARLRELIEVLKGAATADRRGRRAFDMNTWFHATTAVAMETAVDPLTGCRVSAEGACRTAACALGSAALHPKFKRAGLELNVAKLDLADPDAEVQGDVYYMGQHGVEAGAMFFDIKNEQAMYLFDPGSYDQSDDIRPKDVIKRVQEILDHQDPYA